MANNCDFDLKITGGKAEIEELVAMLSHKGDYKGNGLGEIDVFYPGELTETSVPGVFELIGGGDCPWSVLCALRAEYHEVSLESESKRLGLVIEAYSSEPGAGFQEHILIDKGSVIVDECVDYKEYCIDSCDSVEQYNEKYGTNFTKDMVDDNGNICIGGFGENYGCFKDGSRYFTNGLNTEKSICSLDSRIKEAAACRKHSTVSSKDKCEEMHI